MGYRAKKKNYTLKIYDCLYYGLNNQVPYNKIKTKIKTIAPSVLIQKKHPYKQSIKFKNNKPNYFLSLYDLQFT